MVWLATQINAKGGRESSLQLLEPPEGGGRIRTMVKLLTWLCLVLALSEQAFGFLPCPPGVLPRMRLRSGGLGSKHERANEFLVWREAKGQRGKSTWLRMAEDKPSETSFSDEEFKGLMERVAAKRSKISEMPLVVLDAMLPRQRLNFGTADPGFRAMIQNVKEKNEAEGGMTGALGSFAMIGVDPMRRTPMECGTEVGEPWMEEDKYFMCKVEWVEGEDDEEPDDAGKDVNDKISGIVESADKEANVEMAKELEPLVEKWKKLVVDGGKERQPDQISLVLQHLGPMPPAERPRERALWVAALINPLPALGVAMEIRPATLAAKSTAEALTVVLSGIRGSIGHLDGSAPLW